MRQLCGGNTSLEPERAITCITNNVAKIRSTGIIIAHIPIEVGWETRADTGGMGLQRTADTSDGIDECFWLQPCERLLVQHSWRRPRSTRAR
jgi:hypothetical protein